MAAVGWQNLKMTLHPSPSPCFLWNTTQCNGFAIVRHLNVHLTVLSLSYYSKLGPSYDDYDDLLSSFFKDQSELGQAM